MQGNNPPAAGALLSARAMLATVTIKQWSAKKSDKKATREVHERNNARADAGSYRKALVAKAAIEEIQSIAGEARQAHYRLTSPWLDDGARILPAKLFIEYANAIRPLRERFEEATARFIESYPSFVEQAQRPAPDGLGDLFNPADYPNVEKIKRSFDFGSRILPMPNAADFRVDIGNEQEAEIRRSIEESTAEALAGAIRDAWSRIAKVVGAMVERLNAYQPSETKGERSQGVFRDSLTTNIRDLVAILPAFNLTSSPDLDAITRRLDAELCQHEAAELRDNAALRASVASAAEAILSDVNDFLG